MSALAGRPFAKMNGLGNEIVVVDLRGTKISVTPQESRAIHAAKGLAYDQLMVIEDRHASDTEAFVRILNNDGSESGACGNGTRCVAWLLMQNDSRDVIFVETIRGTLECRREGTWDFSVDMGAPLLEAAQIPLSDVKADTRAVTLDFDVPALTQFSAVNMGNPHAIFFVDDVQAYGLETCGVRLEHHPMFPERANISLAKVVARDHIELKVWERGAGLTKACGTAACAVMAAGYRLRLIDAKCRVTLPGGDLFMAVNEDNGHVLMTGPVATSFRGTLDLDAYPA